MAEKLPVILDNRGKSGFLFFQDNNLLQEYNFNERFREQGKFYMERGRSSAWTLQA